jgi:hypothetical protein
MKVLQFLAAWDQGMSGLFEVYKLVLDDKSGRVVERVKVKNIGDDALFLGDNNHSISASANDFPGCHLMIPCHIIQMGRLTWVSSIWKT